MNWTVTWLPVDSISSFTFSPKPQYLTVHAAHGAIVGPEKKKETLVSCANDSIAQHLTDGAGLVMSVNTQSVRQ